MPVLKFLQLVCIIFNAIGYNPLERLLTTILPVLIIHDCLLLTPSTSMVGTGTGICSSEMMMMYHRVSY